VWTCFTLLLLFFFFSNCIHVCMLQNNTKEIFVLICSWSNCYLLCRRRSGWSNPSQISIDVYGFNVPKFSQFLGWTEYCLLKNILKKKKRFGRPYQLVSIGLSCQHEKKKTVQHQWSCVSCLIDAFDRFGFNVRWTVLGVIECGY
jgi:hypothetical protein